MNSSTRIAAVAVACALVGGAHSAVDPAHQAKRRATLPEPARAQQQDWGIAGQPRAVRRTIQVSMSDGMRFSPADIQVREGDTVRLVVVNRGKQPHELVIGTRKVLDAHAALMRRFPTMEHDEADAAHVAPGKRQTLVWTFNRPGDFAFACLIPGHYEAGMVGSIKVTPRKP
ncbi:MAG: cupredoxin family protein [Ramlibacter sp.]